MNLLPTSILTKIMTYGMHAYCLDYQNRRPEHLTNLWKIIDWQVVEKRMQ